MDIKAQATEVNIHIRKARTVTLTITVTGISSWTGLAAKFYYSKNRPDTAAKSITCTITPAENKVAVVFVSADTKDLTDFYYHELLVYNTTSNWQKDIMHGKLIIGSVVKAEVVT